MKTTQKGFIIPLLIIIVAVLVVGAGIYYYEDNKITPQPVLETQPTTSPSTSTSVSATPAKVSAPAPTPVPTNTVVQTVPQITIVTGTASAKLNSDGSYLFDFQGTVTNTSLTYWVEYGTTQNLGSKTPSQTMQKQILPSGGSVATVGLDEQESFQNLNGAIKPGSAYYYRFVAQNSTGNTVYGKTLEFVTPSQASVNSSPIGLTLTSPNGGEVWHYGETHEITWVSDNKDQPVYIRLLNYSNPSTSMSFQCTTDCGISSPTSAGATSFQWTIPQATYDSLSAGNEYKISVSVDGRQTWVESQNYFTIQ